MNRTFHHRRTILIASATLIVVSLSSTSATSVSASTDRGTVRVLSAGSLASVMTRVATAFHAATGYTVQNLSEGSSAIASGLVAKTLQGDVFISASPSADRSIEGAKNGAWIRGYTYFGTSPDVLAYYPKSRFARALRTRPWYDVIRSPGFELGRTNPVVDPSGLLDVDALDGIGYAYNIPALITIAHQSGNVYLENAIPGLLQAGQLDAGFMYAVSADAAALPYVELRGTKNLGAHFTIAPLRAAPDPLAAKAFEKWLLGAAGRRIMERQGLAPLAHAIYVPAPQ